MKFEPFINGFRVYSKLAICILSKLIAHHKSFQKCEEYSLFILLLSMAKSNSSNTKSTLLTVKKIIV